MSGRELIPLLPLAELGEGERRALSAGGLEVLLFCIEDRIYAVENRCSHGSAKLEAGRLRGHQITCPLHSGRFDVRTGRCEAAPATKPIRTFEVVVEAGKIHVVGPAAEPVRPRFGPLG
jgi:nitrite reductase/ring-hydroxylating ferredoxin subunit